MRSSFAPDSTLGHKAARAELYADQTAEGAAHRAPALRTLAADVMLALADEANYHAGAFDAPGGESALAALHAAEAIRPDESSKASVSWLGIISR